VAGRTDKHRDRTEARSYAIACAAMFVFGMILGLPGTVLGQPETVAQFGLTMADRGVLISTLYFGLLFGSLASGPFVDAVGHRAALAVSSALAAVCLPLFAWAGNAAFAAIVLATVGLASASINTASNALASELFPGERARRMNGLGVLFGFGGLAMPAATVLASDLVSWRGVVVGGGVLSALVALTAAAMPMGEVRPGHAAARPSPFGAFRHFARQPGFVWFCLLVLLGGGNEASMAGWTSTFLLASGASASAATIILSSHWLGVILSRLIFSRLVDRTKAAVIERSAIAAALCLLLWVTSSGSVVLAAGPFIIGMAIALVLPTSLALAGERVAGSPGTLFGTLLTLAQVGGMVLPASIGLVAERAGVRPGLALLIASCAAIAMVVRHISASVPDPSRAAPKAG
jgi:fucose permease